MSKIIFVMTIKMSVFIAIITITAFGKSFGAFSVKQLSLNQNSLACSNMALISSTEKYKIATQVFHFSDFQKTGFKQHAMNNFKNNNSVVFGKTDISQNVMNGFSWRNQKSNGGYTLTTGLGLMGASAACILAGYVVGFSGRDPASPGAGLLLVGILLFLSGLIVTIIGLAKNN